jgi:hypothetical protein
VALCLVWIALVGGCGDEAPKATGPAALKYVPADADAVVVVPTDLQGEQLQRLAALMKEDARDIAASLFDDTDTPFARDIEPLLGKDLVLAEWGSYDNPRLRIEVP